MSKECPRPGQLGIVASSFASFEIGKREVSAFYDKAGKRLDLMVWARLFEDDDYIRVAHDEDDRIRISTIWLGINHNFSDVGAPIIFETMIFVFTGADVSPEFNEAQWRWRTEEEVKEGHEVLVRCYHEGLHPDQPVLAVREKYAEATRSVTWN